MVYTEIPSISVDELFDNPSRIYNAVSERTDNPVTKLWLNYDPDLYPKTVGPRFMNEVLWGAPLEETFRYIEEVMDGKGLILDEGAGVGLNSIKVLEKFPDVRVVLSDVSRDFLNVASIELSRAGFSGRFALVEYNVLCSPMPIADESVDLIIKNQFSQFFTSNGRLIIAQEDFRMLKEGGAIIDGTLDQPNFNFGPLFKSIIEDPEEDPNGIAGFLQIRPKIQQFDQLSREGWMSLPSQQEIFDTAKRVGFSDCRVLREMVRVQINQRPGSVYWWTK